ncbi:MAG: hypothetical protein AMXMBFR82_48030 [Candidatus Hydrogenedentota bacterium]
MPPFRKERVEVVHRAQIGFDIVRDDQMREVASPPRLQDLWAGIWPDGDDFTVSAKRADVVAVPCEGIGLT